MESVFILMKGVVVRLSSKLYIKVARRRPKRYFKVVAFSESGLYALVNGAVPKGSRSLVVFVS
jgi:uncharacterized membrane protein